jgi:hypothetical protein
MSQYLPIDLPAGVYANGTEYETKGRWLEANLIRWYEGRMRPIGGWQRFTSTPLPEPARGCLAWRRNDGLPFAAFGTASHLYETSGSLTSDITPVLGTPKQPTVTTATTGGSLAANTYYYVVTALNTAGQTLASAETSIVTTGSTSANTITWSPGVVGAATYRVWRGTASGAENVYYTTTNTTYVDTGAAGTSGTLPTSNTATGVLTAGIVDAATGGFGSGDYGDGPYGESSSESVIADVTTWDLDAFGQILLGVSSSDGKLYQWDASVEPANASTVVASGVTQVPTGSVGMFVTDDRICVLLGPGGNPREIMWSNQGDYTNWDITEATTAGDLQLKTNGRVLAGCRTLGSNIIFTDEDLHSLTYVGYPYIYGTERLASDCGMIARKAFAATVDKAFWMGDGEFYMYNGVVQPLKCDVRKGVFDNINVVQQSKICGGINGTFSEVWWWFPSLNSTECDSYVYFNFKDGHWGLGLGVLGRTCWADRGVWPFPIACGADYNLYEHESGWTNAGISRNGIVSAISGPIEIGSGDNLMFVTQILTDTNDGTGAVSLGALTKNTPNGAETAWGPYPMRSDGYTDCRFTGRQMKMNVSQTADGLWQFGNMRFDANVAGRR